MVGEFALLWPSLLTLWENFTGQKVSGMSPIAELELVSIRNLTRNRENGVKIMVSLCGSLDTVQVVHVEIQHYNYKP